MDDVLRPAVELGVASASQSMVLRGPDESEYELKLSDVTRRKRPGVFVKFSLFGGGSASEVSVEAIGGRPIARDDSEDCRSEGPGVAA